MRLTLKLKYEELLKIPVDYNKFIQAAIYRAMDDPTLAHFLHTDGFQYEKRKFKMFTFSRLLGKTSYDKVNNMLELRPPIKLIISSPMDKLLESLGSGLLNNGHIYLGNHKLKIDEIEARSINIAGDNIRIFMLSPVVTYSTVVRNGRNYTYYYSPYEEMFSKNISSNLGKKARLVHAQLPREGQIIITPDVVSPRDKKIVNFKGTVIKGWMGIYKIKGPKELLQVALDAGIGSKNSQGFGCFDIID